MCNETMKSQSGFSLIELMIVIAIVAFLATIAYPSYVDQIARGRRADAKSVLLEAAQFMERNYTQAGAYNKNSAGTAISTGSSSLPSGLTQAPKDGTTKYYDITITAVNASSYTLRATRKNAMANDKCGNFEISNAGTKALNSNTGSTTVDSCWNR